MPNLKSIDGTKEYPVPGMSELRCFQCGKVISDENNMTVKKVDVGRQAFHNECWKVYHKTRRKKETLQWGILATIAFFMVGGLPIYLWVAAPFGIIVLVLMFAVFVSLVTAYYRVKE